MPKMNFMRDDEGIRINQRTYITEFLQRFGMQDCRPVSTPLNVSAKLAKTEPWTAADGEEPLSRTDRVPVISLRDDPARYSPRS